VAVASVAAVGVSAGLGRTQGSSLSRDPVARLHGLPAAEAQQPAADDREPAAVHSSGRGGTGTVAPAWVARTAAQTGIPATALSAYATADLRVRARRPRCAISWATLAAIGWVESRHGTIDGHHLRADGSAGPTPIRGVLLDGTGRVAAIADSDAGRLDGDEQFDRAVGPMQFIPGTWASWGADGDGDGSADPQDVDDAAWSAARYLCAARGADPATAWARSVLAYNPSRSYLRDVLTAATTYASRVG
jgi:membrane-bound lytic murein transglycosylase B